MKKRIIVLLSIALIALMTFTSCKSVRKAPEDTEAPSVSDKKDTAEDGNEASADTDVPAGKADGTNENIPANAPEASSDNTGKADNSESEKEGEPSRDEQNGAPDTDSGNFIKYDAVGTSSSYVYISPEEMQTYADLIVVGEYTGRSFETIPDESFINGEFMHEKVYTNYVFNPLTVVKGEAAEELLVRCPGGTVDGRIYFDYSTPSFKEGKKYFIFLRNRELLTPNDTKSYHIVTEYCFEIDESEKLIFKGINDEDKAKFQAQYDAAVSGKQLEPGSRNNADK